MQQAYGKPSDQEIEEYTVELTALLADNYLGTATYGFKRGDLWLPATLRYTAATLGGMLSDDRSGSITRGVDISGAVWHSYVTYTNEWGKLTPEQRVAYKARLPFQRVGMNEPTARGGWVSDKSYSAGAGGVRRSILNG